MMNLINLEKKNFSVILGSPTGAKWTVKNESRFFSKTNTSFYSEFNADSEYVSLFGKYWGRKNGLNATCPLIKNCVSTIYYEMGMCYLELESIDQVKICFDKVIDCSKSFRFNNLDF